MSATVITHAPLQSSPLFRNYFFRFQGWGFLTKIRNAESGAMCFYHWKNHTFTYDINWNLQNWDTQGYLGIPRQVLLWKGFPQGSKFETYGPGLLIKATPKQFRQLRLQWASAIFWETLSGEPSEETCPSTGCCLQLGLSMDVSWAEAWRFLWQIGTSDPPCWYLSEPT